MLQERNALGQETCSAGAPGVGWAASLPAVTWGLALSGLLSAGTALWLLLLRPQVRGRRVVSGPTSGLPHFRFAFRGGAAARVGAAPDPSAVVAWVCAVS